MTLSRREFVSSSAGLALLSSASVMGGQAAIGSRKPVKVRRRFVRVDSGNVFYLSAGEGAPVVLIHGSPGDSSYFDEELPELAKRYAVYAFDSPGFGRSDPPPEPKRDVAFLADRIAGAIRALGLPPAVIYGFHTGAAVAMEIAARHPQVVRALMLDGVPMFNDKELKSWFTDFFLPMVPDRLGGQFNAFWTRCRDQGLWFPWSLPAPEQLIRPGVEPTHEIQSIMMRIVQPARTYVPTFRSAIYYGPRVEATLAKIDQPTVILCMERDVLAEHLKRLPPLKRNQSVYLSPTNEDIHRRRDELLERFAGKARAPALPKGAPVGAGVSAHIMELADGREIFMRVAGKPESPALMLIHDAPGSSQMHEPLIAALAAHARVYAIDLPGCGETRATSTTAPTIADFASTVRVVAKELGVSQAAVYGIGFGSVVALELAVRSPEIVRSAVLQGIPLPSVEERADFARHYAPPIALKADGSHWYSTWLMLRDTEVFWPWYKANGGTLRRTYRSDAFDAARLHDRTVEVMKQYGTYHHVIDATFAQDTARLLGELRVPSVFCSDPSHPFSAYADRLAASRPDMTLYPISGDVAVDATKIAALIGI